MPRLLTRLSIAIVLCALPVATRSAGAQALGTFRWQTQPYCNVVTLTVVAQGSGFLLTGSDDLCGTGGVAPATGTAALNPNGSIALGVSVVTPTGATAQISATLNAATVSGTWADADGRSGAFAFNPPTITGAPRPAPTTSGLVTSTQLAASIFAGTGAATTVARSDHLHDDRYYTKPETDATVAAAGAVVLHGPGFNVPNPLVVEDTLTNYAETIVTPRAGRLSITKYVGGYALCSSGTAHVLFLTVDGVPIRGSAAYNPSSATYAGVLAGATLGVIPAGSHVVNIGVKCVVGVALGTIVPYLYTNSTVIVLP